MGTGYAMTWADGASEPMREPSFLSSFVFGHPHTGTHLNPDGLVRVLASFQLPRSAGHG